MPADNTMIQGNFKLLFYNFCRLLAVRIGEKLRKAREGQPVKTTREDIAAIQGNGSNYARIASYELGKADPPRDLLAKVSARWNIPLPWFYDGKDTPIPEPGAWEPPNAAMVDDPDGEEPARGWDGEVQLPVWRGVSAGLDGVCVFVEPDSPEYEGVPAFLTKGDRYKHVLCIASGVSMAPRIDHGERSVVKLDPNPPVGSIVIARKPNEGNFIKVLKKSGAGLLELHSINESFEKIVRLDQWELRGWVTAILHNYEPGQPNIEWDYGRALRG